MTLLKQTYEKMKVLPEEDIKLLFVIVDEMERRNLVNRGTDWDKTEDKSRQTAFEDLLSLREKWDFSETFYYKKELEEALNEKYGIVD